MEVGRLVMDTIALMRAKACSHKWVTLNKTEDACILCGVIATEAGKEALARMSKSHEAHLAK